LQRWWNVQPHHTGSSRRSDRMQGTSLGRVLWLVDAASLVRHAGQPDRRSTGPSRRPGTIQAHTDRGALPSPHTRASCYDRKVWGGPQTQVRPDYVGRCRAATLAAVSRVERAGPRPVLFSGNVGMAEERTL